MKRKIGAMIVGTLFLAAGAHAETSGIGFGPGQSMSVPNFLSAAKASKAPDIILAGDVVGNDPSAGKPAEEVVWVTVGGGKFERGTYNGYGDEKPVREVTIETFKMSKTLVTVEQYEDCVNKRQCSEPATGGHCNWLKVGREKHPVNCVSGDQANEFARFKEARLPTEAEWEYAAKSGGKKQKYPWGDEAATCERAVMCDNGGFHCSRGGYGCGNGGTMPVCSKPAGNAKVSGGELCDMAGNVQQWVQDKYQRSYANAPIDGSAVEGTGLPQVVRGGSFNDDEAGYLRADRRNVGVPGLHYENDGFRLAKSSR